MKRFEFTINKEGVLLIQYRDSHGNYYPFLSVEQENVDSTLQNLATLAEEIRKARSEKSKKF